MPRRDEYTDLAGMLGVDAPTAPRYPVRTVPAPEKRPVRRSGPEIGFLNPEWIVTAFRVLMYAGVALLALLSVVGTFYGRASQNAPLDAPGRMLADILAAPGAFGIALGIQAVLTLTQYGSRQMARHNPRWWAIYLIALGVSLWYNVQAYYEPILAMQVPWLLDYSIIAAGDVVPEFASVRKRT